MKLLKKIRGEFGVSQRDLAKNAGIAFGTLQLLEGGRGNPSLEVLAKLAEALSLSGPQFRAYVDEYFSCLADSVYIVSRKIMEEGEKSWKTHLFNFVDAFRDKPDARLIDTPPCSRLSVKLKALITGVVETLCGEKGLSSPEWCVGVEPLSVPWFVAGLENLKTLAIAESSLHFRKRNIFVLADFLKRV